MLQRLKGAIDSRIAEEQARQKSAPGTPSRSSSNARRSPRNDSRKRQDKPGADTQSIQGPGPDPSDFDGDTVIDSADIQSRSATPQEDMTKPKESDDGGTAEKEAGDTQLDKTGEAQGRQSIELPTDVRVKLRKLEKLESRYQDLLRSYRVAHARVMTIENFETSLRENTPLTSISEPGALLEYLNQLNTKSDMVMQELKRVSGERDEYKSGLELAEAALKKAQDETESSRNDNFAKSSNVDSASKIAENEEFFSYDSELPRLESELKAKDEEVDALQQEVKTLKVDLAVTRESTEGMAKSLETATKELTNLRDLEKNSEGLKTRSKMLEDTKRELGTKLEAAQTELQILKARETDNEESSRVISSLQTQLQSAREDLESSKTSITEHDVSKPKPVNDSTQIEAVQPQMIEASTTSGGNVPDKKNKKKKKKGGKGATVHDEDQKITPTVGVADTKNTDPSVDNTAIRQELDEKSTQIEKLNAKLRDQEGLKEEIETLRDDLVNVGQELVEAKDNVKSSHLERTVLENRVRSLEDQIRMLEKGALEDENTSKTVGENQATELEGLKAKTTGLERELVVAQQLATTRYKDLSDMRQVLQQAQPELISLRAEAADLRTAKADLDRKTANSKKMEAEQENLHLEITSLKKQISDHEIEIKTLKEKVKQEMDQRTTAEELHKTSESERQKAQSEKKLLSESAERTMSELRSIQDAANTYRNRIRELEQQSAKLNREAENYKEEIELKAAQHASAQNLMTSMRGQTTEMSVRMKEARERGESLEEELADAHRLLSERTREGETMRRLLADVESRADVRVREMKDRMETALEERDRAEEDASTMGRRRSRELEELKSKVRDAERSLKRALDDKEDLERAQKEWRRKREELESLTEHSSQEMNEVRQAMNELRDALDESEKQVQSLEQQRSELRNATQDMQGRLEKLYKSNKNLNEEMKILSSAGKTKPSESDLRSPRSSIDSSTSRIGLGISNGFKGRGSSIDAQSGAVSGPVDYVYLKTVLLQFLEQKDKKHQLQLVPVLGMLLHFDRKDEEKWTTAITTK